MRIDHNGKRRRVFERDGVDGHYDTATVDCPACTDYDDVGGRAYGPAGCRDCGYTGKSRTGWWVPFDEHDPRFADRAASKEVRHG